MFAIFLPWIASRISPALRPASPPTPESWLTSATEETNVSQAYIGHFRTGEHYTTCKCLDVERGENYGQGKTGNPGTSTKHKVVPNTSAEYSQLSRCSNHLDYNTITPENNDPLYPVYLELGGVNIHKCSWKKEKEGETCAQNANL